MSAPRIIEGYAKVDRPFVPVHVVMGWAGKTAYTGCGRALHGALSIEDEPSIFDVCRHCRKYA